MLNDAILYFDGVGPHKGGLCDRLKGMYSCWILSKKLNKKFIFNIPAPTTLKAKNFISINTENFQELNIIDWENYLKFEQILKELKFDDKNYIIHTNIDFSNLYENEYSFSDFIKNNFDLISFENDHNVQKYDIGIHIRCGGKMVGWNDYDFNHKFNLDVIHTRLSDISLQSENIFLCSDSIEVLNKIDKFNIENIIISPYEPKHIDRALNVSDDDYLSTFYDLLTLANCKQIYYTFGEFAKTASRIYGNNIQPFYT